MNLNRFYLAFSIIGSFTYVMWGYIVSKTIPNIVLDSFEHRFLVTFPFLCLLLFNYFKKKINIEWIAYIGISIISLDYCYLAAINSNIVHTTGLYVVITVCILAIHKKWFLWLFCSIFFIYCLVNLLYFSKDLVESTHWSNMITLFGLSMFFSLWKIKSIEQLDIEYRKNIDKSKQLEELNNIAAQAAHDIRSPLMALNTFISTTEITDSKKLNLLQKINQRITEIADVLVDEYRKNILSKEKQDIFEKLTVKEIVEGIAKEKLLLQRDYKKFDINITGEASFAIEDIKFQIDLKRALSNIITNSIEAFDGIKGLIEISLDEDATWFTINIQDNGKGISKENMPKIFEKGSSFGKLNGNGLGLYNVSETIKRYNGEVKVSSKRGQGTRVTLIFNKV